MAPCSTHLPFLFLLFLASPLHIQARESQFFNKVTHFDPAYTTETQPVDKQLPALKQEEPTAFTPRNNNGYGLYGRNPEKMSQTSSSSHYNADGNEVYDEDLEKMSRPSTHYDTQRFPASEYVDSRRSYENNKETATNYPDKQYGMSDTRFLENGRYFYDIKADTNYRNGYDSMRGNLGGYRPRNQYNNYGAYSGNNENAYEYNNSMEGYQNSQEENDEEYLP